MEEELKNWEQFREEVWGIVKRRATERQLSFAEAAEALKDVYAVVAFAALVYLKNERPCWELIVGPNEEETVQ